MRNHGAEISKGVTRRILEKLESILKRYKALIAFALAFVAFCGWIIDRTIIRSPDKPAINIYNTKCD